MADIYTYTNLGVARQQLANRLFDPNQVFWTSAELNLYIAEALRTWNALTSYWRGDFLFSTRAGVTWYDLTDTTNLPNTLVPMTLHDTDIYSIIQYHLLEPVSWNPWTGNSAQFQAADLTGSLSRRRDDVLGITGCFTTRRTVGAVLGRITLPDLVIDVRRMAYLPTGGSPSVVWPADTWEEQAFQLGYLQNPPGTPLAFLLSTQPPISFDVDTPPANAGNYELLTVEAGPTVSVGTPTLLNIPDDWAWVLKWGVLEGLLSHESNARDSLRWEYAKRRYELGIRMLAESPRLLALRLGNTVLQIDSVRDADTYRTGWQALAQGTPDSAYYSGQNLVALASVPDNGGGNNYSLTATVVENAPVPTSDVSNIQAGRDDLSAILDYAQHLAAFKLGGAEFVATLPLLERFFSRAAIYNAKLKELAPFTTSLYEMAQRQEHTAPRLEVPSAS